MVHNHLERRVIRIPYLKLIALATEKFGYILLPRAINTISQSPP
jgi:hypothetical protein